MLNRILMLMAACWMVAMSSHAADWKPGAGPLMTKWAKDVSPENVLPEYPRPQMVRKDWVNLNGLWQYAITAKGAAQPANWDGQILVPFCVESALSGVMKPVSDKQQLWYRRMFDKPALSAGGRLLLHFGAVDWQCNVSVNGKAIGTHTGGYDPFTFDITDALKDGANELIVSVYDPSDRGPQPRGKQEINAMSRPGGIWYTPTTGIWQTVWLEPVNETYIESIRVTPNVDAGKVIVRAVIKGKRPVGAVLSVNVPEGAAGAKVVTRPIGAEIEEVEVSVTDAKLWSPESPYLYAATVSVGSVNNGQNVGLDSVETYFGMRKIEVKKDEKGTPRIFLNNKSIFMAGPLDQGYWPDGNLTAPTDAALKYDIEITKQLGFNCTRKHVKVEPARWYYHCDKLGLLVWQDMPSGDKNMAPGKGELARTPESAEIYRKELKALIDGCYNSPCIIMWVVFNEGWGQFDTIKTAKWTKEYDPSRLVNPASGWNDYPGGDVMDMHNYPGPGAPNPTDGRAAVLGEFGGLGLPTEGHMWTNKNWGYRGVPDSRALTRQYSLMLRKSYGLRDTAGLCAAIYTQLTDVETEANGLLTYDRAVMKVDVEAVAKANQGKLPPPPVVVQVLPHSKAKGAEWQYTITKPAEDWFKTEFDSASWKKGEAGFGTQGTPGGTIRTEWKSDDIWLRREFTIEAVPAHPLLTVHHDEDAEIYINGVLAAKIPGYSTDYETFDITKEAAAALKVGKNTIAVHCHQIKGGQYIDVGIIEEKGQ